MWHGEASHCPSVVLIAGHWGGQVGKGKSGIEKGSEGKLMDGRRGRKGLWMHIKRERGMDGRRWGIERNKEGGYQALYLGTCRIKRSL